MSRSAGLARNTPEASDNVRCNRRIWAGDLSIASGASPFVDEPGLTSLGLEGGNACERRPAYHPTVLLEIDVEAASNRVQPSRRLARPCQRNLEPMGFDWPACAGLQDHRRIREKQWRRQSQRLPTLKPFS
ncbi:hypothetical protein KDW59_16875 [Burkholderia vietnamiensis]|nr:hypothetical protein [Burkholderia vietnamiensis]